MIKNSIACLIFFLSAALCFPQTIHLLLRSAKALTGSQIVKAVWNLSLSDRENFIYEKIMSGNIPDFQRNFVPITFNQTINNINYNVTFFVMPDYFAVGSDSDYFLIPMTPILAQRICNNLNCTLPTKKLVNEIWKNAKVKLEPAPISPDPAMTTVPIFWEHNQRVWQQRMAVIDSLPLGELVAGHKKDVVISNKIYGNVVTGRVVIYGWHKLNGVPIQPLYDGHTENYVDYSHGIRLVLDSVVVNGESRNIKRILQNDSLHILLSDEGKITEP